MAVADNGAIAGYYTLAATSVPIEAAPVDLRRRLPYYPVVPAILMGRLPVALERQGQGLGRALIADAVIRTDRLGIGRPEGRPSLRTGYGALALIVDAKDKAAAAFYRASGFQPIPMNSPLVSADRDRPSGPGWRKIASERRSGEEWLELVRFAPGAQE